MRLEIDRLFVMLERDSPERSNRSNNNMRDEIGEDRRCNEIGAVERCEFCGVGT